MRESLEKRFDQSINLGNDTAAIPQRERQQQQTLIEPLHENQDQQQQEEQPQVEGVEALHPPESITPIKVLSQQQDPCIVGVPDEMPGQSQHLSQEVNVSE